MDSIDQAVGLDTDYTGHALGCGGIDPVSGLRYSAQQAAGKHTVVADDSRAAESTEVGGYNGAVGNTVGAVDYTVQKGVVSDTVAAGEVDMVGTVVEAEAVGGLLSLVEVVHEASRCYEEYFVFVKVQFQYLLHCQLHHHRSHQSRQFEELL